MRFSHALITGGAGFIGSHIVDRLLREGWRVTAVDTFDPFYSEAIKRRNIEGQLQNPAFRLVQSDIRDAEALRLQLGGDYDVIVHVAAKAGVRPSIQDPVSYQGVNVTGTQNLLELAKKWGTHQFVFASSSSVYGVNPRVPWRESDTVLLPISPYASTKVSGELLGHVYSHLFGIRFLALRLFTVFGPRQHPDLAIHKFSRLRLAGKPIPLDGCRSAQPQSFHQRRFAPIVIGIPSESPIGMVGIRNIHRRRPRRDSQCHRIPRLHVRGDHSWQQSER